MMALFPLYSMEEYRPMANFVYLLNYGTKKS